MQYRRLGASGLKLSVLSFGSWVSFGPQLNDDLAMESMTAARDAGVNFFDNAESYGGGESERIMGRVLSKLGWRRQSYVVSTKLFWGLSGDVNMNNTLNRKYLLQAIDGSLERFGLDFVDLLFCHRSDPETPVEETVWAMHDIVSSGKALYWGTSEWPAEALAEAYEICDRQHLRRPVMEQPQYNLFNRDRVEKEYRPIIERYGLGLTTWSPLASGLLTGKYRAASQKAAEEPSRATSGYGGPSPNGGQRQSAGAEGGGGRARLHGRSACHRLVRLQPGRLDRHHGCLAPEPGRRRTWRRSRCSSSSTAISWRGSNPSLASVPAAATVAYGLSHPDPSEMIADREEDNMSGQEGSGDAERVQGLHPARRRRHARRCGRHRLGVPGRREGMSWPTSSRR